MKQINQSKIFTLAAQCINAGMVQRFSANTHDKSDYYPTDWDVTNAYGNCVVGIEQYFRNNGYTIINDMDPSQQTQRNL